MRRAVIAVTPVLILALTLLLTACVSAPLHSSSAGAESAWQARQAALMTVSTWTLAGRVAAHNGAVVGGVTDTETGSANGAVSVSATLHWAQQASGYSIDVIPPFGQGAIRLEGNGDGVMLRLADGRQISAANPDTLLYKYMGLRLPITSLRFWVLSMPDPTTDARKAIDDAGRPLWLEQSGWRIEFLRYSQVNGLDLPGKLVITNPPMHLRLVVDRWELSL